LSVALVDDDGDDLLLTAEAVRRALGADVQIACADSFDAGLHLLRDRFFDSGLIDVNLGARSGLELVQQLGGRDAATPLILLTGVEAEDIDQKGLLAGAYDFINKAEIAPRMLARAIRYASHSHQLDGKLRKALRDAQSATRAKSEFLARMSHDLRTPLNAILGFSEIIKEEMFGPVGVPTYAEYAQDINTSALQLLDLIGDILDLSRVEAERLDLQLRELDLAAVAGDIVRLVRPSAAGKGIAVSVQVPATLRVIADERALRRMLNNLISNALKFTAAGGQITVAARPTAGGTDIAVTDTGIGIAARHLQLIRSPFSQIDTDIMTAQTGSGLGLAIVDALMKAHLGRLELESELGIGTTARLCFSHPQPAITGQRDNAAGVAA
jgi:signal transduction histidine kinase